MKPTQFLAPSRHDPGFWQVWSRYVGVLSILLSACVHLSAAEGFSAVLWGYKFAFDGQYTVFLKSEGEVLANGVRQVAFAANYLAGVREDGTLFSWGITPEAFPRELTQVTAIAVAEMSLGNGHAGAALRSDGTVVTWGTGATPPDGLTGVAEIAAGEAHFLARREDGSVVTWGQGSATGVNPPFLNDAVAVVAQLGFSAALRQDGSVVAWQFPDGQLVDLPVTFVGVERLVTTPTGIYALRRDGSLVGWNNPGEIPDGLSHVVSVAASRNHTIAARRDGTVVAWGYDDAGVLSVPDGLEDVVEVAAGFEVSIAVQRSGSVVSWGRAASLPEIATQGVSSIVYDVNSHLAVALGRPTIPTIVQTSADRTVHPFQGTRFEVQANGFGLTYQWLKNGMMQPGATNREYRLDGLRVGHEVGSEAFYSVSIRNPIGQAVVSEPALLRIEGPILAGTLVEWSAPAAPARIPPEEIHGRAVSIATGDAGSVAILSDGSVCNWNRVSRARIRTVSGLSRADSVAVGDSLWFERMTDGRVRPWGWGDDSTPYAPATFPETVAISAQHDWALVLDDRGAVWQWKPKDPYFPWTLFPVSGIRSAVARGMSVLFLRSDGTVVTSDSSPAPAGLSDVVAIAAGDPHCVALRADGTVVTWGGVESSESGVPPGLDQVVAIAAGYRHTLALRRDGTVVGWGRAMVGRNAWGTPVWEDFRVPAGLRNVTAIAAGGHQSMVLLGGFPAPRLTLDSGAGTRSIVWHDPGATEVLEASENLLPPQWTPVTSDPLRTRLWRQHTMPTNHASRFYRLVPMAR